MFSKTLKDRMTVIEPYARQGRILDVGCVDARVHREGSAGRVQRQPNLLFKRLCAINPDTTGLDIDAEGVEALKAAGHQVICGDAESATLGQEYDLIVAGEIIEHLENPGLFLRNMRRHLKKPSGHLILSTPNPFSGSQTWKIWRYGKPSVHEDHAGWHDPITIKSLLARTGFELVDGCWLQRQPKPLRNWRRAFRPYFADNFLIVARPV